MDFTDGEKKTHRDEGPPVKKTKFGNIHPRSSSSDTSTTVGSCVNIRGHFIILVGKGII